MVKSDQWIMFNARDTEYEKNFKSNPRFIGGSLQEHRLFMLALCRFQHESIPLSLLHYPTWSIVLCSLYSVLWSLLPHEFVFTFSTVCCLWSILMDLRCGIFYSFLTVAYVLIGKSLAPVNVLIGVAVGLSGLIIEALLHIII